MIIGASLSKPTLVKQRPLRSIYDLSIVCHSVNKEPRILICWRASIFQYVNTFREFHHIQIIEVSSILHVQWVYTVLDADEHVHVVS